MTRNELKTEAKWAIIEKLEEGYDGYLCDLHDEVFNMEMYTKFDELWNEELTEDDCLVLIDKFKEKMGEEGE